ncbi:MarR family winged helix-turn-helix transcriptional regulator [Gluconobacter oxydans]|uniref:MarR family winged helix-turn-helix transcriptional regulator n=1 Tax=Gluconobacter oxydans TaxID=442 RepID=UPI0007819BA1|nr:MarR family transcriptional regulator [Gluconobacter oxydans]KXV66155.1 MarR family transcriptional regulator [Gluconobacter oxydans]
MTAPSQLSALTTRNNRLFTLLLERELKKTGLRSGQLPVLQALQDGKTLNQKALADFADIEQPGMTTLLARMERDGLIQREADPTDRRSTLVTLTPDGQRKSRNIVPIMEHLTDIALKGFTPLERDILVTLLERINSSLKSQL